MCKYCLQNPCVPGCPNYTPNSYDYYCSICGNGIQNGEDYVVNEDKEFAHWECVSYGRDLANWLGLEIKVMNDD